MDSEIYINRFFLNAMMPMVKSWRYDQGFQNFNIEADVGMYKGRV